MERESMEFQEKCKGTTPKFTLIVQLLGWTNTRTKLSFIWDKQKELDRVSLRFGLLLIPFTYGLCY